MRTCGTRRGRRLTAVRWAAWRRPAHRTCRLRRAGVARPVPAVLASACGVRCLRMTAAVRAWSCCWLQCLMSMTLAARHNVFASSHAGYHCRLLRDGLRACPQAPLVPPDAASRNPTQATSQGPAAKCAPDPAAGAAHGARAAADVARNMAGPSSALDVERFDWRTAPPALLALAAWDAGGDAGAAGGGRVTVGSAAGGPAAAGLGTREHDGVYVDPGDEDVQEPRAAHGMPAETSQGPGTPLASCAEGSAGGSGAAEVAAGYGTESGAIRDGPEKSGSLATMPQHTRWEPTPKQQGPSDAAEAFGARVQGAPTKAAGHERAPLLRLATATCTGALLDLPRGRHLLRLAAGCGRLSVVGVHSSTPFHAGEATQVEPTSRPVPMHPCDSSLTRLILSQMCTLPGLRRARRSHARTRNA